MERVSDAKWGLCLPGNHGRTSREIEYMAAGVPLILTPGVSVNYPEELREGEHFVFAENPDDIGIVTAGVSDEQWASMSKACRE